MGILNLEFAYNTTKVATVLDAWQWSKDPFLNSCGLECDAILNTYFDFIFLFFYSGFLFLACKKIAAKTAGSFSKAGKLFAKGALLAGILDILENIGMLLSLSNHGSSTVAFCTTFASVIKWVLALVALLYVISGGLALLFRKS